MDRNEVEKPEKVVKSLRSELGTAHVSPRASLF